MSPSSKSLISSDQKHLWHPFTQMQEWREQEPLVLVEGREYIDGNSSIWTNIHGHRHPKIDAAIRAQLEKVAHVSFLGTTNEPAIRLAEKLVALFPPSTLERVFYSDNGSTAVEVAVKMALQYWQLTGQPRKTRFIAFDHAYHGDTVGAASLGGVSSFTSRFSAVHFPVARAADVAALAALEKETPEIAALIIEPLVQGAAGIRLWPAGMLKELRAWCDAHEVLLIFDEVLTGFGRTGKMFACQHEDVLPDFLCLAKALTAGYLPLAATLTTDKVFAAFLGEHHERKTFFYGHSYCGNALGCAAALASLEVFAEEKTLESLASKITLLTSLLDELENHPHVGAVRQCGFIAGIELQYKDGQPYHWTAQMGQAVCLAARRHGLLTRPILDTIVLMPPYCITDAELTRAVAALKTAIGEACT